MLSLPKVWGSSGRVLKKEIPWQQGTCCLRGPLCHQGIPTGHAGSGVAVGLPHPKGSGGTRAAAKPATATVLSVPATQNGHFPHCKTISTWSLLYACYIHFLFCLWSTTAGVWINLGNRGPGIFEQCSPLLGRPVNSSQCHPSRRNPKEWQRGDQTCRRPSGSQSVSPGGWQLLEWHIRNWIQQGEQCDSSKTGPQSMAWGTGWWLTSAWP